MPSAHGPTHNAAAGHVNLRPAFRRRAFSLKCRRFVVNGRRFGIGRHRIQYPAVPRLAPLACPMHFAENNVTDCAPAD